MTANRLRKELEKRALSTFMSEYHLASRTHIFFVPWFTPFGAKGFGDFQDEAFEGLRKSVHALLRKATLGDLKMWMDKSSPWAQT